MLVVSFLVSVLGSLEFCSKKIVEISEVIGDVVDLGIFLKYLHMII